MRPSGKAKLEKIETGIFQEVSIPNVSLHYCRCSAVKVCQMITGRMIALSCCCGLLECIKLEFVMRYQSLLFVCAAAFEAPNSSSS